MALRDIYPHQEAPSRYAAHYARWSETATDRPAGLLEILWRRKLTLLATLLLFLAGGLAYIVVTPPRYLASTSMLIDPRLGKTVGSDPVQPGYVPDASAMDSQIKLFTSQTVLDRVARMAHLEAVPEFNGSQRSFLNRLLHPRPNRADEVDLVALEKAITIQRPERTYLVGIDVLARRPDLAAEIANDITKAYIEDQISSRIDAAREDSSFVKDRLAKLSTQIKNAEDRVEAYKVANSIVDSNGLRSNEQQVADLTRSLGDARAKESDARATLAEIDRMASGGHLDAIGDALRSPTIERYRQQQAETDQAVAKLAESLGPSHPELKEAQARKRELRALIRAELARLKMSAQQTYDVARQHERQIVAGVSKLKAQSTRMSGALVPLEALERNVRVLRSSFDRFAQVNDSVSQQEAESPPGRVIAVARSPVSPARPKKTLVGLVSLAGGLFFGLAAALLAESMSPMPASRSVDPPEPKPRPRHREPYRTERAPEPPARPRAVPRRYWDDDDADA